MSEQYNIIDILRCHRTPDGSGIIGCLYINDNFFCHTLEPVNMCIPCGSYPLSLDIISPKYQNRYPYKTLCSGKVPRLLNVPHRDGILIHIGNFSHDSLGCILVGVYEGSYLRTNRLISSTFTFTSFYNKIKTFKYPIKVIVSDVRKTTTY